MVPTRARSGSTTGSSGGSVVNELVDRFDPGQAPEADESPATAENVEDAEEVDEGDDGLLARLRRRIGLGDDDPAETEDPDPESLDEPDGTEEGHEPASDEPEPAIDADEPAEPAPQPAPVSAETGRPAETRDRPPRGTDAGPRVPARPAPSTETDDDARRRVRPTVTAPGPAPPTGGDLVPGHPDLDGQPERSAGFDDIDVPDPEILHEQVDAVLDHHETGPRRDRP